ncbi:GNAT family N-acetyltransferase [Actinopolymorpha rutila]|uniref:RimJ/RimL family protein N-acetyltransferase n=1 Tax=Actinopolymorpha rutila TaxID=446787 RepID=A0A852ZML4_9ACTN|nr:GNAT family N-acetyltransferase [Actinopolymorpha rutila]NYH89676.1 RimJ/RimL family protein N-acetyltransferase [Actinopolymorpha rutila]
MAEIPRSFAGMDGTLSTERLKLEGFRIEDASELHEIFSDPATHTIGSGPFSHIDETTAWIERRIAAHRDLGLCWYGVRLKSTGRLLGNCGLFVGRTGAAEPELGYMVRHDSQRRGYASEAASAVILECDRAQLRRLWATVRPANVASMRVLDRIGMKLDRTEHDDKGSLHFLSRTPDWL